MKLVEPAVAQSQVQCYWGLVLLEHGMEAGIEVGLWHGSWAAITSCWAAATNSKRWGVHSSSSAGTGNLAVGVGWTKGREGESVAHWFQLHTLDLVPHFSAPLPVLLGHTLAEWHKPILTDLTSCRLSDDSVFHHSLQHRLLVGGRIGQLGIP